MAVLGPGAARQDDVAINFVRCETVSICQSDPPPSLEPSSQTNSGAHVLVVLSDLLLGPQETGVGSVRLT
jgi:hypothetical protein